METVLGQLLGFLAFFSEPRVHVSALIWWCFWFGGWATGQGASGRDQLGSPAPVLPAPKRPSGMAADLRGKGVKALFFLFSL